MDAFPKLQELTFSSESSQSELTFFQDLMKNLLEQRRSVELCDIIIKVQNDKLHCHKSILGAIVHTFTVCSRQTSEKED